MFLGVLKKWPVKEKEKEECKEVETVEKAKRFWAVIYSFLKNIHESGLGKILEILIKLQLVDLFEGYDKKKEILCDQSYKRRQSNMKQ